MSRCFSSNWYPNPAGTSSCAGRSRDDENSANLDYAIARYYDNRLGRFTSPDWALTPSPVPYADYLNPQSLNLYGYVSNDPLTHSDSGGHTQGSESVKPNISVWEFDQATDLALVTVSGSIVKASTSNSATIGETVIYDSESNSGSGLTDKQKTQFATMQKGDEDLFGKIGIHFDVKFTSGYIIWGMNGYPVDVIGSRAKSLNVFVMGGELPLALNGPYGSGAGSSAIQFKKAFTFI